MRDLVFVAVIVAFFLLTAAYVHWADGLVGEDELGPSTPEPAPSEPADAPARAEVTP